MAASALPGVGEERQFDDNRQMSLISTTALTDESGYFVRETAPPEIMIDGQPIYLDRDFPCLMRPDCLFLRDATFESAKS